MSEVGRAVVWSCAACHVTEKEGWTGQLSPHSLPKSDWELGAWKAGLDKYKGLVLEVSLLYHPQE